jgi:hypothetical protein
MYTKHNEDAIYTFCFWHEASSKIIKCLLSPYYELLYTIDGERRDFSSETATLEYVIN